MIYKLVTFRPLLPSRIQEAAKTHKLVEQELAHAVNATALVLTEAKLSSPEVRGRGGGGGCPWTGEASATDLWSLLQCLSRSTAVEIVNSSKVLQAETRMLLDGKLLVPTAAAAISPSSRAR